MPEPGIKSAVACLPELGLNQEGIRGLRKWVSLGIKVFRGGLRHLLANPSSPSRVALEPHGVMIPAPSTRTCLSTKGRTGETRVRAHPVLRGHLSLAPQSESPHLSLLSSEPPPEMRPRCPQEAGRNQHGDRHTCPRDGHPHVGSEMPHLSLESLQCSILRDIPAGALSRTGAMSRPHAGTPDTRL